MFSATGASGTFTVPSGESASLADTELTATFEVPIPTTTGPKYYYCVVTNSDAGVNVKSKVVTVNAPQGNNNDGGSGGGGCEVGLGLGALAALMAFTKFSKRR